MASDLFLHVHDISVPDVAVGGVVVTHDVAGDQSPFCDLRPGPAPEPRFAAVTWTTTPDQIGDRAWKVERVVVWDDSDPKEAVASPGVLKQVALVRRRPDLARDEFINRYSGHGVVARAHHGMVRYAQNYVIEATYGVVDDSRDVDGISELWFASRDDWKHRFYLEDDSPAAVRADTERFIDFGSTGSAMVETGPETRR